MKLLLLFLCVGSILFSPFRLGYQFGEKSIQLILFHFPFLVFFFVVVVVVVVIGDLFHDITMRLTLPS